MFHANRLCGGRPQAVRDANAQTGAAHRGDGIGAQWSYPAQTQCLGGIGLAMVPPTAAGAAAPSRRPNPLPCPAADTGELAVTL